MTGKSRIYFHLGLPKTASTYLQRVVFPQLKGVVFHKKHDFKNYTKITATTEKIHLFTNEMDKGIESEMEQIARHHPSASVILVFRSHFSWILSKYKYSIRKWNHLNMTDYYAVDDEKVLRIPKDYYRSIIEHADRLFPQRVLVLNYHDLKNRPGHLESRLQDFIGLPAQTIVPGQMVNKAFSNRQLVHLRRYNRLHRYTESRSKIRWIKRLHYRYRQYLLHVVAFFSRFIPADVAGFKEELKKEKAIVESRYRDDWAYVLERSA